MQDYYVTLIVFQVWYMDKNIGITISYTRSMVYRQKEDCDGIKTSFHDIRYL